MVFYTFGSIIDDIIYFRPWHHTFDYIWRAFRHLPGSVQRLCNTQFFAWMGWFPFLFYRYYIKSCEIFSS